MYTRWIWALSVLAPVSAWAGSNSYVLPDGTNRAPAVVLHCVTATGGATPCGIAANPLVVSSPAGGSSSASQQAQFSVEQATSQAVGTVNDSSFTGGAGSVISVLKAVWSSMTAGLVALPAGGTFTSHTTTLAANTSTVIFPVNPGRHYISFQVPQNSGVWINVMGGPAAANAPDCAFFAPGTFYESGSFVNRGAISVFAPAALLFSAWEG